ncbi:MAG: HIT domain-containing protein [Gammaproteobacteria bacterium]|nr:HIT domain-containing protein [Gammaproteobacteria bacterium]
MNSLTHFELDPRLNHDCFTLGHLKTSRLLLLNNALVPWFILVPDTAVTEIYQLPQIQQLELLEEINLLSDYLYKNFTVDKLNIASIGNIVNQMHIHLVARRIGDFCWPGVVWGADGRQTYDPSQVAAIKSKLIDQLGGVFSPC